MKERIQEIFGQVSDELETAYVQIRKEVMAQIEALEDSGDLQSVYHRIIASLVTSAAKEQKWTKAQIDRLIAHLEDECGYTSDDVQSD